MKKEKSFPDSLTVKKFIKILNKVADPDIAEIEFLVGEKSYRLKHIGQFSILPDVIIELEEFEPPMMKVVKNFRRDKQKEVNKVVKKIKSETK